MTRATGGVGSLTRIDVVEAIHKALGDDGVENLPVSAIDLKKGMTAATENLTDDSMLPVSELVRAIHTALEESGLSELRVRDLTLRMTGDTRCPEGTAPQWVCEDTPDGVHCSTKCVPV